MSLLFAPHTFSRLALLSLRTIPLHITLPLDFPATKPNLARHTSVSHQKRLARNVR